VGTSRRPIILQKGGHLFVGPDNGVFTFVLMAGGKTAGYEITPEEIFLSSWSATFHGRDIFAPVAGHLSLGKSPHSLGRRAEGFVRADWPKPVIKGKRLQGRILFVDSFGNLITNIDREEYGRELEDSLWRIKGKGWSIEGLSRTYGQTRRGQSLALFGSAGLLEIAVNCGNAQKELGLGPGDPLAITLI
jgi:S-adenosylmethionine hydrolase